MLGDAVKIELVSVALPGDFGQDVFIVVVPHRPAQFIVVHVRLIFPFPPLFRQLVRVHNLELTVRTLPLKLKKNRCYEAALATKPTWIQLTFLVSNNNSSRNCHS